MTPEQFYTTLKDWPVMSDKSDKKDFRFTWYDLCQFAADYTEKEKYEELTRLRSELQQKDEVIKETKNSD